MSVLKIERTFPVQREKVFAFLTRPENLLKWWGPEGMNVRDHTLDLSKLGAWSSDMVNAQGGRHKASGVVVAVDPPKSVEFTWGWHDDNDERGYESVVRFELEPSSAGGTHFVLIHSGLTNEESAANHGRGWASSLKKLERLVPAN